MEITKPTPNIFVATATGFAEDGFSRLVTVVGIRKIEKNWVWDTGNYELAGPKQTKEFHFSASKQKESVLYIAYTIQNPEDKINPAIAQHICERRIKKHEHHMDLSSLYVIPGEMCQAIVQSEADRIAAHIDGFLRKSLGLPKDADELQSNISYDQVTAEF